MKYSFMSFSCQELTLGEMLNLAQRFGYDGVEPRVGSGHKHGIELDADIAARKTAGQQAADNGIEICCLATSCHYADTQNLQEQIDLTRRCIDLAGDVGSPRLRVFGGELSEGLGRQEAIEQVAAALQSVADYAAGRGVTVCMETHDAWCDPAHVAEVMKLADRPAIAVNWDIMHPVRVTGATIDHAYQTLKPWIQHVHIHDGDNLADEVRFRSIGEGAFDHRRTVQLLRADGYDGFLSGEWIAWADPYETHLPRELATMKRYENQA